MDPKVIDCPKCGFRHLDPIPKKDEIEDFYESQYYQEGKTRLRSFELSFAKRKERTEMGVFGMEGQIASV